MQSGQAWPQGPHLGPPSRVCGSPGLSRSCVLQGAEQTGGLGSGSRGWPLLSEGVTGRKGGRRGVKVDEHGGVTG